MDVFLQDLRYAFRRLRQSPGFTAVAVTIMGLGIGANTAIFSIVNAVLLRQQPFENPSEIVRVFTTESDGSTPAAVSYLDFYDYRDRTDLFAGTVATNTALLSLTTGDATEAAFGEYVSWDFFSVLGLRPHLGRTFTPEEDEPGVSEGVALLTYPAWQRRHGADPGVVGSTVRINGRPITVVGVGPEGFNGSMVGITSDYLIPFGTSALIDPAVARRMERRTGRGLFVYARLQPGVNIEQADAGLNVLAQQLAETFPESNEGRNVVMMPANDVRLHPVIDSALYPVAALLMVVVGLVLLVACTNLANLLLVRASGRRKEVAIRIAMGARRARLMSQLLTESTLLGVLGGAVGLLVAFWTARLILSVQPPIPIPIAIDLSLDSTVLGFTVLLSVATGVVFGLVPALKASRPDLVPTLKDGTQSAAGARRKLSLRNVLVVGQVAISLVLLIAGGLFVRSLRNAQQVDPGFEQTNAAMATLDAALAGYDSVSGPLFYAQLLRRLEAIPGVEAATVADLLPLGAGLQTRSIYIDGYELPPGQDELEVDYAVIGRRYFETLGIPMVRGRAFSEADVASSPPVVIVSAAMARRFWGTEDVVGEQLRFRGPDGPRLEIVGVARDTKVRTLGEEPRPYLYSAFEQEYASLSSVIVRTSGDPAGMPEAIRREINAMDSSIPLLETKTMTEHLGIMLFAPQMGALLLSGFGVLAMILASIGLYGVVAFSVAQRTREVGIRVALGAPRSRVVKMVVMEGMALVTAGVVIGLGLGMAATRPLSGLLIDVPAADPLTFAGVSLLLAGVAFIASYVPARRAARVDPMVARRYE